MCLVGRGRGAFSGSFGVPNIAMIARVFLCVLACQPETSECTIREDGLSIGVGGAASQPAAENGVVVVQPQDAFTDPSRAALLWRVLI